MSPKRMNRSLRFLLARSFMPVMGKISTMCVQQSHATSKLAPRKRKGKTVAAAGPSSAAASMRSCANPSSPRGFFPDSAICLPSLSVAVRLYPKGACRSAAARFAFSSIRKDQVKHRGDFTGERASPVWKSFHPCNLARDGANSSQARSNALPQRRMRCRILL